MNFNQVRYFLAVADTLNFTRAAERCYVSQPALTQAIQRLETELGGELIRRDGRYIELTELGKSLYSHFQQIDRTRHLIRSTAKAAASDETYELNIGLMCTIGPQRLTGLLEHFQMQRPTVSLVLHDVTPATIADLLMSGALDGAFCGSSELRHSQVRYIDLFNEAIVVAFPQGHEFSELDAVPLNAVAKQRYVDRLHCEFRGEFLQHCHDQNLRLNVTFRSQREDWIQSLIHAGIGVSVIPQFSLLQPLLEYRPVVDPPLSRTIKFALVDQVEMTPELALFLEQVQSYNWERPAS